MATSADLEKARAAAEKNPKSFVNELLRGDLETALWRTSQLPENYQPIARQMVQDMASLGALRPQTLQAATGLGRGTDVGGGQFGARSEALLGDVAANSFKSVVGRLPTFTGGETPGGGTIRAFARPEGMSAQDFITANALSTLSGYLDPQSQQSAREYLARENPALFGGYSLLQQNQAAPVVPTTVNTQELAQRLGQAAQALTPESLAQGIAGTTAKEIQQAGGEAFSPVNWLRNYLMTAQQGIGGTRAQQRLASERLSTLEREAADAPQLQNLRTFAENLINPVARQTSLSNILGQKRTLGGRTDEYRRGNVALRNASLV